ncbi:MAG TPA: sialate O-acetylesterase [Bacteroidales bacterium]|nr:sialate O-acetylesterase [Bacteroidales bacterium]
MKTNILPRLVFFILLIFPVISLEANITLPALISDGMVLQRDTKLTIWGWASPGEKVTLTFNKKVFRCVTDISGNWSIILPAMKSGGPFSMKIKGLNTIIINDILVGDVWFCSGQSNMVLTMERVRDKYADDISSANLPMIRNFFVPTASDALTVHRDLPKGKWLAASPADVLSFGAVTYFFARSIYKDYNVPVGIINSSVGGTPIEAWISEEGIMQFPLLTERLSRLRDTSYLNPILREARKRSSITKPVRDIDKGTAGPKPWYDTGYIPEGWHKFWLPGYWDDQGVRDLHGVVWFRKEIIVPESMTGKEAKLMLGRIVDADQVYVNGVLSGNVTYQYPPRRYILPAGLLKPGKNLIVIRITNNSGKGGFVPDKPYFLAAGTDTIDLRGEWMYKVGQAFRNDTDEPVRPVQSVSMQNEPTGLYNTMVHPLINFRIRGILWYQGETNTGRPKEYVQLLPALISDWRKKFDMGPLPFLFVQLANFMEVRYLPSESQWAELRFSQFKSLSVPNTAMAVAIDAGEWNDIHPLNKKDVGERLALAAKNLAYGNQNVVWSGPLYKSVSREDDRLIIEFDHTGGGLIIKGGGELCHFAIAGADKKFVWADAKIENNRVVVRSNEIAAPLYIRYAWADNPEGANLYNAEGLPASPFEAEVNK